MSHVQRNLRVLRAQLLFVLVASLLVAAPARAQILNGSFESDYANWTLFERSELTRPCYGTWGIATNGFTLNPGDIAFDYFDGVNCNQSSPGLPITFITTDGNKLAFQLQTGGQFHRMYQDIAIGPPSTLHWDMGYRNHSESFNGIQNLALRIRDLADNILQTLFITTQGVTPQSIPMTHFSADLSAYTHSTVRLSVELQAFDLWFDAQFDNFKLGRRNPDGDFDGDGKADITVFRPSTGVWHTVRSSTGTPTAFTWGNSADRPVVGDFDGDGKTDIAVFRPSNGTWYIVPSTTGVPYGYAWGNGADIAVPGDYDGDGKSDIAVFRPSNGSWYVVPSRTGVPPYGFAWGNGADIAVPGDYDRDGKTDIAVFRPSNGTWYVVPSSTGVAYGYDSGNSADANRPVPSDYDGDGKTDIAVFLNGTWNIVSSRTGVPYSYEWGNGADVAVPGDYDGDGKSDIAVFRPSNGTWYVVPSTTGVPYGFPWGNGADIPILRQP